MLAASKLQAIICTTRMPEAERFYSEVLGLPLTGRSLGALVYDVGGTALRVSPVPSWQPSEHTVLGFAVPDLESLAMALRDKGILAEEFPGFDHDALGIVRAPDGNILSAVQYA